MIETLKPWLRAIKYSWLQYSASYRIQSFNNKQENPERSQVAFLIGCGRSGTTILGEVLSQHPKVCYFFEPYHLWATIDAKTDVLNLFHSIDAQLLMDTCHRTTQSQARFNRLIQAKRYIRNVPLVIEKTPLNAMRIGYLNALAPTAKFIHIVRDGIEVANSIERIALNNSYQIAGKPQLNQWWGVKNYKWIALSRDGVASGYYPDEVGLLDNHQAKGAYEWLVSLGEVDHWRDRLGDRLYEITYDQLVLNPETVLCNIYQFLELEIPNDWIHEVTNIIHPIHPSQPKILSLPPTMCEDFNRYQEHFSFPNRAIPVKCT